MPLFGLAPWSALELRPRIALPSAKVSNSVADHCQEAPSNRESRRNDNYFAVTFSAEATRMEKYLTRITRYRPAMPASAEARAFKDWKAS
jgi:hypothetical protein